MVGAAIRLAGLTGESLLLVWRAAPRSVLLFAALQVLAALVAGAGLLVVKDLAGSLLAAGSLAAPYSQVAHHLTALAGVFLVAALAAALQRSISILLGERAGWYVFERVLDVACQVELERWDSAEFHARLLRAQNAGNTPVQMTQGLVRMTGAVSTAIAVLVVVYVLEPFLVLILVLAMMPLLFATTRFSRDYYNAMVALAENDMRRHYIRGLLTGREMAAEVRAFGLPRYLRAKDRALFEQRMAELRRIVARGAVHSFAASTATGLGIIVSIGVLLYSVSAGRVSLATATAGLAAIIQIGPQLNGLAAGAAEVYQTGLFMADYRAFRTLLAVTGNGQGPPRRTPPRRFGEIKVERVTFSYRDAERPALDDVSLMIREGETVALVGENGSGKTTLAKLLCGLYAPSQGRIRWDGTDLADMEPNELRSRMAVAFQDFGRYLFTAAENIGLGRPDAARDLASIERAARAAGADRFISKLPLGYDTVLGRQFEGGVDLSLGQWQRMALARAFYRDAPLVILDEPTASLDAIAEYDLFESIRSLFDGRTVLLISHRFSTVRSADRIYTLEAGTVIETGTHSELLHRGGKYAKMFTLQASAFQAEGRAEDLARPIRPQGPAVQR